MQDKRMQISHSLQTQNQTADKQLYALMAEMPAGWIVTFKPTTAR
jgi:hypothetical protein